MLIIVSRKSGSSSNLFL